MDKITHLLSVPFTGLGLYSGWRGNRWLKNRIQIFKQFVVPSLQNQTSKNFILHCCWRPEEKSNPHVKELIRYMEGIKEFKTVHTFYGIMFYDDKHPDDIARERLITSIHSSMGELVNAIGECDYVLQTIQPSDDCYHKDAVQGIQGVLETDLQATGFKQGYICNYLTKEVAEYNPLTNPPFFTIKFPRDVFIDPLKHIQYISLKKDSGKYKMGTACPSHEYISDCLKYGIINERGFLVGCHGENVSTHFNHPYKGEKVSQEILKDFGIYEAKPLKVKFSLRKKILNKLPYKVRRKLRYWWGEKLYHWIRA
jgi:hypothetical protein